jgi:predicted ATP-grasp superfamily ATP-dependent carboligase
LFISPFLRKKDDYFRFVLNLVQCNHFDLLIPVGALPVQIFANNLGEIQQYVKTVIPGADQVNLALDKNSTYQMAQLIGIDIPQTIYPQSVTEALELQQQLHYPLIMKSGNEASVKFNTLYIDTPDHFQESLQKACQLLNGQLPVIQEKVTGDGYGFYAVYNHGQMIDYFMHKRVREFPVEGGVSSCAVSYYDDSLKAAGQKVLDYLKWHGPAMVEFKRDAVSGVFKLIEINPKFWGSLDLSMVAGINFPALLCDIASQKDFTGRKQGQYRRKIGFHWLFATGGDFYRLKEKPGDWYKVLCSLFHPGIKNDFWITDPLPNLKQFADYFLSFFVRQ